MGHAAVTCGQTVGFTASFTIKTQKKDKLKGY